MYFAAVTASMEMAKEEGPYSSLRISYFTNFSTIYGLTDADLSGRWDWSSLRKEMEHGVRNY
jgi:ribonucleoside-diphosphate reductase alpha chain